MLHVDVWYLCVHRVAMPTCQRLWDIWLWQNILPYAYSYFCHTRFFWLQSWAPAVIPCGDTEGMYTGVICDLGWSLVNMVLLHWSCQSDNQSVSQFSGRRLGESGDTHAAREGAGMNGSKTSIPSSQSQSTEPLKWCRMSQEACRVELGEGGPNVTVPTLKSVPVNYHKWHDGLEKCYWTL